jgi:hypothetical protein
MIFVGDCLEVLRTLPDCSVDAVVTDPPYGLSFMGKRWDYDVPSVEVWAECLRVLKPGGHLLAFAGTRTQHRIAVRIEDAGFEIRDMIAWVYGSGFPKSLDVSKAIDKAAGVEREVVGANPKWNTSPRAMNPGGGERQAMPVYTASATKLARQWQGWGTALKPALEPITVARKPLIGTVAENVLAHGTGALNVDGCRVPGALEGDPSRFCKTDGGSFAAFTSAPVVRSEGRWPANLIHDGSDEVVGLFPNTTSGSRKAGRHVVAGGQGRYGEFAEGDLPEVIGDSGSAARFFYCAKASKADRDEGCEGLEERETNRYGEQGQGPLSQQTPRVTQRNRNHHPTVKPTALMQYLCRLVTPPGGVVLDPFMGSGSTGAAAMLEGFQFIGIEREAEYVAIARERIESRKDLFSV